MASPAVQLDDLMKAVGVSLEKLDQKCTDEHLPNISQVLERWRTVLPRLGLSEVDREDIDMEGKTEAEKRLKMLQKWLEKYGPKATFKQLVEVLLTLDRANQAEKVCSLLAPQDAEDTKGLQHHLSRTTPGEKEKQQQLREHRRKETDLLLELTKDRNAKWWQWPWKSSPKWIQPSGELLFNNKTGGLTANAFECMIIASVGDKQPHGSTKVKEKQRDDARYQAAAQRAIREGSVFPNTVPEIPEGLKIDLMNVSSLMRDDPTKELVSVNLDLPGTEQSRDYYLQMVKSFFSSCRQPGAIIWYTGHSEEKTGNWVFKDGVISFQDIFDLYRADLKGRLLLIVSDCCHSGKWVHKCAEILDEMKVSPCGHQARKKGVLIKVFASCQPDQLARDPCYSIEGVYFDHREKRIIFRSRKFTDSQTPMWGDFTKLLCCGQPEVMYKCSTELRRLKWADFVSGKIKLQSVIIERIRGRPHWHYVLFYSDDDESMSKFKKLIDENKDIDITEWGYELASGRGNDPPQQLRRKINKWTAVTYTSRL